ncbi:MAG: hypothetical protein DMF99_25345 [Acidobacteria bacterium]|nr:MAG: hypothetical protein DMF99_25345 [Acidobacteriota bacterium]
MKTGIVADAIDGEPVIQDRYERTFDSCATKRQRVKRLSILVVESAPSPIIHIGDRTHETHWQSHHHLRVVDGVRQFTRSTDAATAD